MNGRVERSAKTLIKQGLSYKVPERSEWERGAATLSNLLPRLEPAGEILLLLKQNVEERESEGEVTRSPKQRVICIKENLTNINKIEICTEYPYQLKNNITRSIKYGRTFSRR
jgi:hypothetical protein